MNVHMGALDSPEPVTLVLGGAAALWPSEVAQEYW